MRRNRTALVRRRTLPGIADLHRRAEASRRVAEPHPNAFASVDDDLTLDEFMLDSFQNRDLQAGFFLCAAAAPEEARRRSA